MNRGSTHEPPQMALGDWIDAGRRRWPDVACLVTESRSQTYAETADRVDRLAGALLASGLVKGDRIGIVATDSIEHVELILACFKAGVVVCDLNFRLRRPELENIAAAAGLSGLFWSERYAAAVKGLVTAGAKLCSDLGPGLEQLIASSTGSGLAHAAARGEDIVSISFTSGTTGVPKGVLQSERMIRNITYSGIREMVIKPGGFRYSGASLFHISGIGSVLYAVASGCTSLLLDQFDAPTVLHWMQHRGLTHCTLIPTMISSILELPEIEGATFPELRTIMYGGAAITPALLRRMIEVFDCDLFNGFGAGTEAGGQTMLGAEEHRRAMAGDHHLLGSIGTPILGVDLRLCDADMNDVAPGEVGEIVTRSETVMSGYLDQPELTARSLVDGWFRAGDMAYMDEEGFLYLATRKSDMIIRGGENVYPNEIESVLAEHPAVAGVSVVGLPDEHWGEVVAAVVVVRDDTVTTDVLREWCRARLASYKVPEQVVFMPELPTNANGKVQKRLLVAMLSEGAEDVG